jgi:hypothetical protein
MEPLRYDATGQGIETGALSLPADETTRNLTF